MNGPYGDLVLDANDVCNGCLRHVRQERVDPVRAGMTREYEESLERDPRTTEIGFAPADSVSDHKGVFCAGCGTESPHARFWAEADVGEDWFRELLRNLLRTCESKGVSLARQPTVAMALQEWRDGACVDDALHRAVNYGVAVASRREDSGAPSIST
jgi:predicted Fe-S protein YdhL (DUF1289 family)